MCLYLYWVWMLWLVTEILLEVFFWLLLVSLAVWSQLAPSELVQAPSDLLQEPPIFLLLRPAPNLT